MAHSTDIVAYMFNADLYCPACILDVLPTGDGEAYDGWKLAEGAAPMTTEDNLSEIAYAFGIDRMNESTFDSDVFPKVVFRDQLEDGDICGKCGELLGE